MLRPAPTQIGAGKSAAPPSPGSMTVTSSAVSANTATTREFQETAKPTNDCAFAYRKPEFSLSAINDARTPRDHAGGNLQRGGTGHNTNSENDPSPDTGEASEQDKRTRKSSKQKKGGGKGARKETYHTGVKKKTGV